MIRVIRGDSFREFRFYLMFPEIVDAVSQQSRDREKIVDAVRQQLLPWTHYRELIRVEDDVARQWYADESRREGWSSRTLHRNPCRFA